MLSWLHSWAVLDQDRIVAIVRDDSRQGVVAVTVLSFKVQISPSSVILP